MRKFAYGNKILRAIPQADQQRRSRLWFPAVDVEQITGTKLKVSDLKRADLRPGIDFRTVNTKRDEGWDAICAFTYNRGGNPKRVVLSDSGLFHVVFAGQSKFSKEFRNWITDEVWPAVFYDGVYITPDNHQMKELVDQIKKLEADMETLKGQGQPLE
jgi:prophage antirepressor-like protein